MSSPQQTRVPPPALVTVTSFPQILQRYFSPTSLTAMIEHYLSKYSYQQQFYSKNCYCKAIYITFLCNAFVYNNKIDTIFRCTSTLALYNILVYIFNHPNFRLDLMFKGGK